MKPNQIVNVGAATGNDPDLIRVLQENFAHARHQEVLRERQNNVYWIIWGGLLSFVYSKTGNLEDYPLLFAFLSVVSIGVLLSTLKWTAEYGNHISAVAVIAGRLGLNSPAVESAATAKVTSPLPYPEFKGVMALPLRFPIILTVGAWMCIAHGFGAAAAVGLTAYGITAKNGAPSAVLIAWVAAIIAFVSALGVCVWVFSKMKKEIKLRTAEQRVCEGEKVETGSVAQKQEAVEKDVEVSAKLQ